MDVEYRESDAFPNYRFGSDGSVWSCRHTNSLKRFPWKLLTPSAGNNGYLRIALSLEDKNRKARYTVHSLILTVFHGPRPDGMQACHNNGNLLDNRPCNLRWDTAKNNCKDKFKHGTQPLGEQHHAAKLTDEKTMWIRHAYAAGGHTFDSLAHQFGVTKAAVSVIIHGIGWKHLGVIPCVTGTAGEKNGMAKLTESQAKEIRELYAGGGWKQKQLADKFGVSFQTISRCVRGTHWPNAGGVTSANDNRGTRKIRGV